MHSTNPSSLRIRRGLNFFSSSIVEQRWPISIEFTTRQKSQAGAGLGLQKSTLVIVSWVNSVIFRKLV